jgi:cytochrome c oxidase cbb3-type subunit 2
MTDIFNNHKKLYTLATAMFLVLTLFVAILPAYNNQKNNAVLPGYVPLNEQQERGRLVYINEGCIACHSQQVRNVDMDKMWGSRPGIAADYAHVTRTDFWRNSTTLMGTERTGPDLTNVGKRQPSADWNLLHLYQPRALVNNSVMPAYPWLFEEKTQLSDGDIEINVPEKFRAGIKGKIVASQQAKDLLAYLQSLKQVPLPDGTDMPIFLYKQTAKANADGGSAAGGGLDGAPLYAANCQSCHLPNGEGLPGAFPPLKGSKIVLDDNIETFVTIIMKGYDANPAYGVMPAVGTNANLKAEEIAAIMTHERSSWGNNAKKVSAEEVQKIMDMLKSTASK